MSGSIVFGIYADANPLDKCCSDFENLRKHEDFQDLEIQVKGGLRVAAQKIVLAARIPFLRTRVNRPAQRWDREDVDFECAEAVVSYAYTGRLSATKENVLSVISFCITLKLEEIVTFFTTLLVQRLDLDNLPLFWTFSEQKNLMSLKNGCIDLMQCQFETFISTPLFIQLNFQNLESIISSDVLNIGKEETVFEAIKTWILAEDQFVREKNLTELAKCIRWGHTSVEFRKFLAASDEIVERSPSCVKYLLNVEHNISNPQGLFNPNPRNKKHPEQIILTFGEPSSKKKEWIVDIFDPDTQNSKNLAHITFREAAAIVSLSVGEVMITGGEIDDKSSNSVEIFSFLEKQCRPVATLNIARAVHGACAVGDAVIVCGGWEEDLGFLNSPEVYFKNRWRLLPAMMEPRAGLAVISSPDRRVFAIGGRKGANILSNVEVCRLPEDLVVSPNAVGFWTSLAPMRVARSGFGAVLFQGNIFVAGGWTLNDNLSSTEMLNIDIEDEQWVALTASMESACFDFSLVVCSQGIFSFGNHKDPCNVVERLKVRTNLSKVTTLSSQSIFDEVSSAQWEYLSPINSMNRVHRAVLTWKTLA